VAHASRGCCGIRCGCTDRGGPTSEKPSTTLWKTRVLTVTVTLTLTHAVHACTTCTACASAQVHAMRMCMLHMCAHTPWVSRPSDERLVYHWHSVGRKQVTSCYRLATWRAAALLRGVLPPCYVACYRLATWRATALLRGGGGEPLHISWTTPIDTLDCCGVPSWVKGGVIMSWNTSGTSCCRFEGRPPTCECPTEL